MVVGTLMIGTVTPSEAQQTVRPPQQVVSANPFGLLLEFFNTEYERRVSDSTTAGIGGSFRGDDYVNADLFYRFYPSGTPLEGFAFGVKAGITRVAEPCSFSCVGRDRGSFFGFGIDTNYSWLLGKNDKFYIGVGFGLKRLFGKGDEEFGLEYIPTIRIISVGVAF